MLPFLRATRSKALHWVNHCRLHSVAATLRSDGRLPVFVIASPLDMHLAPLAVRHGHPRIAHVIAGNGLSPGDVEWIRGGAPGTPVVRLKASFQGNPSTFLSHAEVVRLCEEASRGDFCIQDADCFVTDPAWWNELCFESGAEYAVAPFRKPIHQLGGWMPETYLVRINKQGYCLRQAYGVHPDITTDPKPLGDRLRAQGVREPYFPDTAKAYFDTLQKHWLAAFLDGEQFRVVPGADTIVHHIGGSSYLTGRQVPDVSHWGYWPLNTIYFHLRILEFPQFARFRPRFGHLYESYGSAERILAKYPDFRQSQRFARSEKILGMFNDLLRTLSS